MDAECYSCHAPVAAGLEKPPPSGDRWLRPEDPNRRLPSRSHATVAAGVEKPPPSGDRWLRPVDPNRRLPSRSHAPVATGLERPPPSGDRWLRPERGPESSAAKSVQGTRCGADTGVSHGPMARAITETSEVSP
jgi:hypothetical protein